MFVAGGVARRRKSPCFTKDLLYSFLPISMFPSLLSPWLSIPFDCSGSGCPQGGSIAIMSPPHPWILTNMQRTSSAHFTPHHLNFISLHVIGQSVCPSLLFDQWGWVCWLRWGRGVGGAGPGGPSGRRSGRSRRIWRAWRPCACGSGASTRPSGRTSTCSRPTCTCMASHLHRWDKHSQVRSRSKYLSCA